MSAKDALNKFYRKQMAAQERAQGPRRKNTRPEFEVKKAVLAWLKENGFSCHAIEAKAVYSYEAGRYLSGQTVPGVADIFGSTPDGIACFIELKAKGRKSTLKPHQYEFLVAKIEVGAFAVCVDSVQCLAQVSEQWRALQKTDPPGAKTLLLEHLPKVRASHGSTFLTGGPE